MWNNLVVLKIVFCKIRAASIYGIVRGCEMPALTTKCEQALLIVLAGMWFRPPDPSNQVYLFQGRLRAKQFFMFALVFFSIELRASVHVSATIILIFWQVQLLISSPLPISCFVFLFMGHTFQQATATPGILERLWSTECILGDGLVGPGMTRKNDFITWRMWSPFNLKLTGWVLISRKTSLKIQEFQGHSPKCTNLFPDTGLRENFCVQSVQLWMHVVSAPSMNTFVKSCPATD